MTIEFKIGSYYRMRAGRKVYLYGIRQSGTLCFETGGDSFTTLSTGKRNHSPSPHTEDIVSEWREPHRHESVVWTSDRIGSVSEHCFQDVILGFPCQWDRNKVKGDRKFKVTVEEILE